MLWGPDTRRIRLVAYGARLESVLGASPRGFESRILRRCNQQQCPVRRVSPASLFGPVAMCWVSWSRDAYCAFFFAQVGRAARGLRLAGPVITVLAPMLHRPRPWTRQISDRQRCPSPDADHGLRQPLPADVVAM